MKINLLTINKVDTNHITFPENYKLWQALLDYLY